MGGLIGLESDWPWALRSTRVVDRYGYRHFGRASTLCQDWGRSYGPDSTKQSKSKPLPTQAVLTSRVWRSASISGSLTLVHTSPERPRQRATCGIASKVATASASDGTNYSQSSPTWAAKWDCHALVYNYVVRQASFRRTGARVPCPHTSSNEYINKLMADHLVRQV